MSLLCSWRRVLAVGAALACVAFASSPPPTLAPAARPPADWADARTLDRGWEFVRGDLGGVWEALRSDERALNLPVWEAVSLPHSYNARDGVDPVTPYYQGPAWYRTALELRNPYPNGRTLLHFEGVGQKAEIWIGDQRVGSHVGGYDEFVVDITGAVEAYAHSPLARLPAAEYRVPPGRVPLTLRCDNSRDLELLPSALSDFSIYGGIHRPVHLVYLPAGGLRGVTLEPHRDASGAWRVRVIARRDESVGPASGSDAFTLRVIGPDGAEIGRRVGRMEATPGPHTLGEVELPAPQLWSPGSPALYGVEVALDSAAGPSRVWQRFGLRTFDFTPHGPFQLNGERLLLRGTHRHEDHAGQASAQSPESLEREMRLMKDMGANFIRLGHYQQARRVLELCDELGLLVWEEIPWCRGGLGGVTYREQARRMLAAMIEQHRNHPSIILWGLGNENDWPGDFATFAPAEIRAFMAELHALAKRLDPTRLTAIRRCDFCADVVDVYSPSIWAGWYRGRFTEYQAVTRKQWERFPRMFHAEWGGDSHAGRHAEDPYLPLRDLTEAGAADERGLDFASVGGDARASRDGDWSETYICNLIDWHLKEQEKMPWLSGSAMWPFKDFSTPLRPENPVPFVNQKGAVERDLTPKEAFHVYRSYWSDTPMVRVYGHSWPVRWGKPGEKRWVHVYSNCPEVELWVNGVSAGTRRRDPQDFPAAGLRWEVPFLEGMNSVRAVGAKDGARVGDEISFRYETRRWGPKQRLRLQQTPLGDGRVRVAAELLDAAGVVCLDARDLLRFGCTGDGTLLDNLGTAGGSRHVQLANGRGRIDVRLPAGGQAVVSAQVEGVPTEFITLTPEVDGPGSAGRGPASGEEDENVRRFLRTWLPAERARVVPRADAAMSHTPVHLRSVPLPGAAVAAGAVPGDYFSMGDYWWPNPATSDGLPYVRRDGESNPGNFDRHRLLLREMREHVAAMAAAYVLTREPAYALRAAEWLRVFFVDPVSRMTPHLRFAQAIPGVSAGRGIGIIDTLHLCEVALALEAIADAPGVPRTTVDGVRSWFREYLQWLRAHPQARDEAATLNNHSVAFYLQVAVFAGTAGDGESLAAARAAFREQLLPGQLAPDGSFPRELARTKPFGYSIFQLDNVVLLAEVLSAGSPTDFRQSATRDGRSVAQAVAFLYPYLEDPVRWPFGRDVAHFEAWPVRQASLLFGGLRLGRPEYLRLWLRLPADSTNLEVRRNLAMTEPALWLARRGGLMASSVTALRP